MNQDDYKIADNLPASLDYDNVKELAELVDKKMAEVNQMVELVSIYPRIEELSSDLINALAIQFHVDYYNKNLPLDTRRSLVKNSFRWHLRKGTKSIVEEMVKIVFNDGVVQEWWEYNGEPYHFRVDLLLSPPITTDGINEILYAINLVKNVRSWLDQIGFLRKMQTTQYYGGQTVKSVKYEINPAEMSDSSIVGGNIYGGIVNQHKSYSV